MAEQFIGSSVCVDLHNGAQVRGIVHSIDGSVLTLRNGPKKTAQVIDATQIADLSLIPQETTQNTAVPTEPPQSSYAPPSQGASYYQQIYTAAYNTGQSEPSFVQLQSGSGAVHPAGSPIAGAIASASTPLTSIADPAIVSYARNEARPAAEPRLTNPKSLKSSQGTAPSLHPSISQATSFMVPSQVHPANHTPLQRTPAINEEAIQQHNPNATGTLQDAINALSLAPKQANSAPVVENDGSELFESNGALSNKPLAQATSTPRRETPADSKRNGHSGKKTRRGKRTIRETADPIGENTRPHPNITRTPGKGGGKDIIHKDGWRQGEFTETPKAPAERVPGVIAGNVGLRAAASTKKGRHRRQLTAGEDQDGWATEDATDIQTMGDFDFEGNLSKFDKKTIFKQIQADDVTTDDSRLHSFNRMVPKPGTAGGKNLHYSENVLDGPNVAAETSDDGLQLEERTGRSSNRGVSRQSNRQLPSRKGSMQTATGATASTAHSLAMNRIHSRSALARSPQTESLSNSMSASNYVRNGPTSASRPTLRIANTNRLCGVVNPLQMLDIERIMETEIGLSEDMMTENAARGIADIILSSIHSREQIDSAGNLAHSRPLVVILAGNQRSGSRAIAAGRHLRNHGVQVMACVLGLERESEFLEGFKRQLKIFRNAQGKVVKFEQMAPALSKLDAAPNMIIDSLLGTNVAFEDLRVDDQATAFELIRWANQSKGVVLSVDSPSGIDATSGETSWLEGSPLHVEANIIVSLGAPKSGILAACVSGEGDDWQIFVVDIGITNAAWRKYGTRRRFGVEFGHQWFVQLQYHGRAETRAQEV